jgi:hypothetical protein
MGGDQAFNARMCGWVARRRGSRAIPVVHAADAHARPSGGSDIARWRRAGAAGAVRQAGAADAPRHPGIADWRRAVASGGRGAGRATATGDIEVAHRCASGATLRRCATAAGARAPVRAHHAEGSIAAAPPIVRGAGDARSQAVGQGPIAERPGGIGRAVAVVRAGHAHSGGRRRVTDRGGPAAAAGLGARPADHATRREFVAELARGAAMVLRARNACARSTLGSAVAGRGRVDAVAVIAAGHAGTHATARRFVAVGSGTAAIEVVRARDARLADRVTHRRGSGTVGVGQAFQARAQASVRGGVAFRSRLGAAPASVIAGDASAGGRVAEKPRRAVAVGDALDALATRNALVTGRRSPAAALRRRTGDAGVNRCGDVANGRLAAAALFGGAGNASMTGDRRIAHRRLADAAPVRRTGHAGTSVADRRRLGAAQGLGATRARVGGKIAERRRGAIGRVPAAVAGAFATVGRRNAIRRGSSAAVFERADLAEAAGLVAYRVFAGTGRMASRHRQGLTSAVRADLAVGAVHVRPAARVAGGASAAASQGEEPERRRGRQVPPDHKSLQRKAPP